MAKTVTASRAHPIPIPDRRAQIAAALSGAAILAAACAALAAAPAARAQQAEDAGCVTLGAIDGYQVIDDRHLLLTAGPDQLYLVTTASRCSGLRFGAEVGVSFGDNVRLCPPLAEYVIPSDGWRCAVESIIAVDSEDEARDRAAGSEAEGE